MSWLLPVHTSYYEEQSSLRWWLWCYAGAFGTFSCALEIMSPRQLYPCNQYMRGALVRYLQKVIQRGNPGARCKRATVDSRVDERKHSSRKANIHQLEKKKSGGKRDMHRTNNQQSGVCTPWIGCGSSEYGGKRGVDS